MTNSQNSQREERNIKIITIGVLIIALIVFPVIICVTSYVKMNKGINVNIADMKEYVGNGSTFFLTMLTVFVCISIKITINHFTRKCLIISTVIGIMVCLSGSDVSRQPIVDVLSVSTNETILNYFYILLYGWCIGLQVGISTILLSILWYWHDEENRK